MKMSYTVDMIEARIMHNMGLYETMEIKHHSWYNKGIVMREFVDVFDVRSWKQLTWEKVIDD